MQINSFQDLVILGLKGYLKLVLQPKTSYRRLPVYSIKEDEYYITVGVFIMPQTKWILNNLEIALKGFIIDTTWKAMSGKVLESDQGPALLDICSDYSMQHLNCLHHLLKGFFRIFFEIISENFVEKNSKQFLFSN